MSKKEIRQFIANANEQNPGWDADERLDGLKIGIELQDPNNMGLFNSDCSFSKKRSNQVQDYWIKIYCRFTDAELNEKINISELKTH